MKLQLKATVVAIVVLATASLAATGTPAAPARTSAFPSNGQLAWVNPTGPCEASDPCGKVVVANPDGKARRTIHLPWDASYPVWSPDGSKLLVIARRPNLPPRPAIVNPDGSDLTVLDPPNLGLGSPFELGCTSWSPDGTRLLCAAVNGGPGGGPASSRSAPRTAATPSASPLLRPATTTAMPSTRPTALASPSSAPPTAT